MAGIFRPEGGDPPTAERLPLHDELAIPPLVKVKKEESSYSRVFETDSSKS